MSKEKNPNAPANTPPANEPPAAPPAPAPPAAEPPAPTPAAPALTQADLDNAVAKAKKEWEKQIKEAEDRANLSETDRLKADNEALQRTIRLGKAETDVVAALEKAGAAKSAKLLFDAKKGELEFDDSGKLTNLAAIIDDLKSGYADHFGVEKPNESINGGAGQQGGGNGVMTQAMIDKMTPQELMANMPAVDAFLATLNK